MALKLPTLKDIISNPGTLEHLTVPQLQKFMTELETILGPVKSKIPASPAAFAEKFSNGLWKSAPHLELISNYLVDLYQGKRKRVLVSMPPRHGKTEFISHWFPLWFLAMDPTKRVILASAEQDFSTKYGRRIRNAILNFGGDLGLNLDASSTAAHRWDLTTGGGMLCVGVGSQLAGYGAHALLIDDAVKDAEAAQSDLMKENLWDWWVSVAQTRLEPGGFVIVIGTRWAEDDLMGRLEKFSEQGGQPWDVIKIPALAEEDDPLGRLPDEPLWPMRFDKQALLDIKLGMSPMSDGKLMTPYQWNALYQQNPTPEEGAAIKRTWWNWYTVPPVEYDVIIQAWDLAFKDLRQSDYTVGQVWGRKGAQFFLLDQIRARMDSPETIAAFRNLWRKYPTSKAKLVEDKANGPAVIQMLRNEIPGVIPWPPRGQGMAKKDARLSAVSHLIEAKNVYLPRPEVAPWITDFVEECAAFPNGTNDDQLDAMVHALTYLQPQSWGQIRKDWKEAQIGPPPTSTQEILKRQWKQDVTKLLEAKSKEINNQNRKSNLFRTRRIRAW